MAVAVNQGYAHPQQLFDWMNERHAIYLRKERGDPWPWTKDTFLKAYRFTNVFRELDKGTIALRKMEKDQTDPGLIVFNTVWYRFFNLARHARDLGFVETYRDLEAYIVGEVAADRQVFTGCHLVKGEFGMPKHLSVLETLKQIFTKRKHIAVSILTNNTLERAFDIFKTYKNIGPFLGYEIASDLRWSLIPAAKDIMSWCSVHGGSKRGLLRLGMPADIGSVRILYIGAADRCADHVKKHTTGTWPPLELREIEHCLCEFDKYERVRLGEGKPKEKYSHANLRS